MRLLTKRGGWSVVFVCWGSICAGKVRIQAQELTLVCAGQPQGRHLYPLQKQGREGEDHIWKNILGTHWKHFSAFKSKAMQGRPCERKFCSSEFHDPNSSELRMLRILQIWTVVIVVLKWEVFVELNLNVHSLIECACRSILGIIWMSDLWHPFFQYLPLNSYMPGSKQIILNYTVMMLGQEKRTSMSKSKRSRLVWALTKLH